MTAADTASDLVERMTALLHELDARNVPSAAAYVDAAITAVRRQYRIERDRTDVEAN